MRVAGLAVQGSFGIEILRYTETVETVAESYLVREGLISRTPRGRVATAAAYEHLGLRRPDDGALWS